MKKVVLRRLEKNKKNNKVEVIQMDENFLK